MISDPSFDNFQGFPVPADIQQAVDATFEILKQVKQLSPTVCRILVNTLASELNQPQFLSGAPLDFESLSADQLLRIQDILILFCNGNLKGLSKTLKTPLQWILAKGFLLPQGTSIQTNNAIDHSTALVLAAYLYVLREAIWTPDHESIQSFFKDSIAQRGNLRINLTEEEMKDLDSIDWLVSLLQQYLQRKIPAAGVAFQIFLVHKIESMKFPPAIQIPVSMILHCILSYQKILDVSEDQLLQIWIPAFQAVAQTLANRKKTNLKTPPSQTSRSASIPNWDALFGASGNNSNQPSLPSNQRNLASRANSGKDDSTADVSKFFYAFSQGLNNLGQAIDKGNPWPNQNR